jgi:hypothetical protein
MNTITYSGNTGGKLLPDSWIDVRKPDEKFFEGNILDVIIGKSYAGSAKDHRINCFPLHKNNRFACLCGLQQQPFALDKILRSCYGDEITRQAICSITLQWNRRHLPTQVEMFAKYWAKAQEKHTIAYQDIPEVTQKEMFTISNA